MVVFPGFAQIQRGVIGNEPIQGQIQQFQCGKQLLIPAIFPRLSLGEKSISVIM
jgi:hypothetical protein